MVKHGDNFRNRLKDGPTAEVLIFPEPKVPMVECDGCRTVLREDETFDGLCEDCSLEQRAESDPRFEYGFIQDFQS